MPVRRRRVGARARARIRAVGVALAILLGAGAASGDSSSIETAVKATYLYKLPPFIGWPPNSFAAPRSPLVLCIVGQDPFGSTLDAAISGVRVGERAVEVRRMETAGMASGCHVMYLGGSAGESIAEALAATRASPILTVTDKPVAGDAKGIVHFVIRDNRVRFEIDNTAAIAAGLSISSKVLSLATEVR